MLYAADAQTDRRKGEETGAENGTGNYQLGPLPDLQRKHSFLSPLRVLSPFPLAQAPGEPGQYKCFQEGSVEGHLPLC